MTNIKYIWNLTDCRLLWLLLDLLVKSLLMDFDFAEATLFVNWLLECNWILVDLLWDLTWITNRIWRISLPMPELALEPVIVGVKLVNHRSFLRRSRRLPITHRNVERVRWLLGCELLLSVFLLQDLIQTEHILRLPLDCLCFLGFRCEFRVGVFTVDLRQRYRPQLIIHFRLDVAALFIILPKLLEIDLSLLHLNAVIKWPVFEVQFKLTWSRALHSNRFLAAIFLHRLQIYMDLEVLVAILGLLELILLLNQMKVIVPVLFHGVLGADGAWGAIHGLRFHIVNIWWLNLLLRQRRRANVLSKWHARWIDELFSFGVAEVPFVVFIDLLWLQTLIYFRYCDATTGHVIDGAGTQLATSKHINLVNLLIDYFNFAAVIFSLLVFLFTMVMVMYFWIDLIYVLAGQVRQLLLMLGSWNRLRHLWYGWMHFVHLLESTRTMRLKLVLGFRIVIPVDMRAFLEFHNMFMVSGFIGQLELHQLLFEGSAICCVGRCIAKVIDGAARRGVQDIYQVELRRRPEAVSLRRAHVSVTVLVYRGTRRVHFYRGGEHSVSHLLNIQHLLTHDHWMTLDGHRTVRSFSHWELPRNVCMLRVERAFVIRECLIVVWLPFLTRKTKVWFELISCLVFVQVVYGAWVDEHAVQSTMLFIHCLCDAWRIMPCLRVAQVPIRLHLLLFLDLDFWNYLDFKHLLDLALLKLFDAAMHRPHDSLAINRINVRRLLQRRHILGWRGAVGGYHAHYWTVSFAHFEFQSQFWLSWRGLLFPDCLVLGAQLAQVVVARRAHEVIALVVAEFEVGFVLVAHLVLSVLFGHVVTVHVGPWHLLVAALLIVR